MSKPFRTSIGFILLVTTLFVASCQSMVNVMSSSENSEKSMFELDGIK